MTCFADLQARVDVQRILQRDLRHVVLDLLARLDHLAIARQLDLAGLAVDGGADVVLVAVLGAPGLADGLLHGLQHLVALDALVAGHRVGDLQQLGTGNGQQFHG